MSCCKVPIKIKDFSGCAKVTATDTTVAVALTNIDTNSSIGSIGITLVAYLGLKCINLACPPTFVLADDISSLVAFLDATTTFVFTQTAPADMTIGEIDDTVVKYAISKLIAGCGCACR